MRNAQTTDCPALEPVGHDRARKPDRQRLPCARSIPPGIAFGAPEPPGLRSLPGRESAERASGQMTGSADAGELGVRKRVDVRKTDEFFPRSHPEHS